MKLMLWSKVANMLAPEHQPLEGHVLVLGKKEDSSAQVRSNYNYLKSKLSDAVEIKNGSSSYLVLNEKSTQVADAQKYLTQIKEEEFLDIKSFKEEQMMDNLHHHKAEVPCGLCGKPLSSNRATLSNLGPICEHKVNEIISEKSDLPEDFKSIYSEPVSKGEMVWVKIDNQVEFVEVVSDEKDQVTFINHKDMVKELNTNSNFTEVLKENLFTLPKSKIQGVARVVAKKVEDKPLFDDLMEIFK